MKAEAGKACLANGDEARKDPGGEEATSDNFDFKPINPQVQEKKMFRNVFSFSGRIRRKEFIISYAVIFVLGAIEGFTNAIYISLGSQPPAILNAIICATSVVMLFQVWKRLHDIGLSGWIGLLQLIPILNIVFDIFLMAKKGDEFENEYGASPK